jgi:hypothetical protein
MPACSPAALRRTSLGRRKDCKAYVEFHHREKFLRVTPIARLQTSFYFAAESGAIASQRRIGHMENQA